jgi:hypothetical protein
MFTNGDESIFVQQRAGIQYASPVAGQSWADLERRSIDADPDRAERYPLEPATYIDRGEGWLRSANQVEVRTYLDAGSMSRITLCGDCFDHHMDYGARLMDATDTAPDTACDTCSHRNGRWAGYGALVGREVAESYRCGVRIVPDDALDHLQ